MSCTHFYLVIPARSKAWVTMGVTIGLEEQCDDERRVSPRRLRLLCGIFAEKRALAQILNLANARNSNSTAYWLLATVSLGSEIEH
jgi:hypothetical protein